jgi:diaminopimelate decarboxylase
MSKPMGAVPGEFHSDGDGMLLVGGRRADDLAIEAGDTPLFVYDAAMVAARIARFRAAFPGIGLHYALKANPYEPLLRFVSSRVDGLDVASEGEMQLALRSGRHLLRRPGQA